MALRTKTNLIVGLFFLLHTWGVKAKVEVEVEGRVEVPRGKDVQIPCLYTTEDGIGALTLEWLYLGPTGQRIRIYHQDTTMRRTEPNTRFTDRIKVDAQGSKGTGQVNLTIMEAQLEDEVDLICHIKSLTDGHDEGQTQLRVFETPSFPTIEGLLTGIWYNNDKLSQIGSCEVKNAYPRPNITWYKDRTPLVNSPNEVSMVALVVKEQTGLFSLKSELSLKVVKADKDANFSCEVNYLTTGGYGMMESESVRINVNYPLDKASLWVESPKGLIKEGDTVELQCHGDGNPQSTFTFKFGDEVLQAEHNVVQLSDVKRHNSGLYKCSAINVETYEDVVGNTTLTVNYLDPVEVSPDTHMLLQGGELNVSCNALCSLDTHTVWVKNGVKVATGNMLSLRDVVYDTAGIYECVVTVPELVGMERRGELQLFVHGPPEMHKPRTTSLEEMLESTVDLTCSAGGSPPPTITWTSAGVQIDPVSSNVTEYGVVSKASIKVTSDMNVSCNASNDYGSEEVVFSIKAKSSGVIIAVIIICLLLLAVLGSVLYFLYKKGKICGRSGKQDLTKEKTSRDNIVVEMKSDNTEEAVLLAVNGDKKPSGEQ